MVLFVNLTKYSFAARRESKSQESGRNAVYISCLQTAHIGSRVFINNVQKFKADKNH